MSWEPWKTRLHWWFGQESLGVRHLTLSHSREVVALVLGCGDQRHLLRKFDHVVRLDVVNRWRTKGQRSEKVASLRDWTWSNLNLLGQ